MRFHDLSPSKVRSMTMAGQLQLTRVRQFMNKAQFIAIPSIAILQTSHPLFYRSLP